MIRQRGRVQGVYSVPLDRGKRHYWNTDKRDYGLCQSVNPFQSVDQVKYQSLVPYRRYSTLQNHTQRQDQQGTWDWRSAQKNKHKETNNLKKSELFLVSNNIEVSLPPIKLNPKQVKSQNPELAPKTTKQPQSKQFTKTKYNKQQSSVNIPENTIKIQNLYQYQQKGRRKVKYSPTYVCSTNNPLPTFKLFGTKAQRPVYQYGYAEQNQF